MRPGILALFAPVAILVAACSSTAGVPPSTFAPTSAPLASPTSAVAPTAIALTGEVVVNMTDAMRFAPDPITVKAGEPITFIVTNAGQIIHEFFVGTETEQADHAAEMAMGAMTHGHANALRVDPGKTGSLTMTFAEPGTLLIGCHEPGHYDAGMKATLSVVD